MGILTFLGISASCDIDVTRPISFGLLSLGVEAAQEAVNVINAAPVGFEYRLRPQAVPAPVYWDIVRDGGRIGEVFGFPTVAVGSLPTAIETAIVRAIELANPNDIPSILSGNHLISNIQTGHSVRFGELITVIEPPLCGSSVLTSNGITLSIRNVCDERLSDIAIGCIKSSFSCAPIKFRFIELYRVMESRFMSDILLKINATFMSGPKLAIDTASTSLSSELQQLIAIGSESEVYFERIRNSIIALRNGGNLFAHALLGKLNARGGQVNSSPFKSGAALVYYVRCSVVHSGEKDLIYEGFADAEDVLTTIMDDIEKLALSVCGIDIS